MTNQIVPDHVSFLLRLWKVKNEDGFQWRNILLRVDNKEQKGFADLENLFLYIRRITGSSEEDKDQSAFRMKDNDP